MHGRLIAMWSGPRNLSTALMRSFQSRADTFVTDEPWYAPYLLETGMQHPGRAETLRTHETQPEALERWLCGVIPEGKSIWYQKQMAHHLLPETPRDWLEKIQHGLLLRTPEEVVASYAKVLSNPSPFDLGFPQQWELFQRFDQSLPVFESADILQNPEDSLQKICASFDIPWDSCMLSWKAGKRKTDGAWAPYWYANVEASTEFGPPKKGTVEVPSHLKSVVKECRRYYDKLVKFKR